MHSAHLVFPLTGLLLLGCQQAGPAIPQEPAGVELPELAAPTGLSAGEHLAGLFDLTLDPGFASATITPRQSATAQPPQALSYDLDIAKFLSYASLHVESIDDTATEVIVTVAHRHPFAAPDFTLPITGKNRADLSYTGRLLILADQNVQTVNVPGEGPYRFDPGWIANPDGYLPVGDLLAREGLTANVFPYKLLVDEALDNRREVSNGGDMSGNYEAASGGWQRGNIGADGDGWTGYDYIHAGQSVRLEVRIRKSDLGGGPFTMPLAILIKYTDPRGEPGPFARFPFEPVDVTRFAYRLPYAALDVSDCAWCDRLDVSGLPNVAQVSLRVRDWDAGAEVGADADLSDETDVSLVQPGAEALPIVEVVAPAMLSTPVPLTRQSGNGQPGEEFVFSGTLTNENGIRGEGWMFFRARDPEGDDPAFGDYHFGVDPDTILPDAARALKPQTLMPVYIRAWDTPSWVRPMSGTSAQNASGITGTPQGTFLLTAQYNGAGNDMDPAECNPPVNYAGSNDMALQEIDESGNLVRRWVWADVCYNAIWDAVADDAGNIYISFSFESETSNWQPRMMDFDPGPGVDNHLSKRSALGIIKLDAAGNYVWGGQLDDAKWPGSGWIPGITTAGIAISDTGDIALSGTAHDQIDVDPGPGVALYDCGSWTDWFITVLNNDGTLLWGLSGSGGDYEYCSAPLWKQNGNVALTGNYSDLVDLDPGAGTHELPEPDRTAGFRAEWTRTGTVVKATPWSHDNDAFGEGLAILEDSTGGEYLIGRFARHADLDLTAGEDIRTTASASRIFFSRYTAGGAYEWTRVLEVDEPTFGPDYINGAGVQSNNDLIFSIDAFGYAVDVDPGPATVWFAQDHQRWTGWMSYNSAGQFNWVRGVQRPTSSPLFFPGELQVAPNDRLLMTWNGRGTQDIDPGPGVVNLSMPTSGFGLTYFQADGSF